MALIGRVRVATSGWTGGPGLNTFYFENAADPTTFSSTDAQDCVSRVQASFNAQKGIYPSAVTIQVSNVVDVLTSSTGVLTTSYGVIGQTSIQGTGGTVAMPIAAALCVSLLTVDVVNGKRVRGRCFLSPIAGAADSNGTPNATQVAASAGLVDSLRASGIGAQKLVVWHRPVSGAGGSQHECTSTNTKDQFAVLRSRRD